MKKRRGHNEPISWLPIDSRIITPFWSFSRVHGVARVFLITEILLSVFVVMGTLVLLLLSTL